MVNKTSLEPGVYHKKPDIFVSDIESCACIIKCKNKILFLQKAPGKWSENLWGIPCGTKKANEDIFSTMSRELYEEICSDLSDYIYKKYY